MSQTVTRDNYQSSREAILLCPARCVKKAGVTTDPSRRKTTGKSHPQIGPGRVDSEWNPAKGFTVMMLSWSQQELHCVRNSQHSPAQELLVNIFKVENILSQKIFFKTSLLG